MISYKTHLDATWLGYTMGHSQFSFLCGCLRFHEASPVALVVKNLPASTGDERDTSLIPESERSTGVGNGNLLQYSCLKNSMDREL